MPVNTDADHKFLQKRDKTDHLSQILYFTEKES